MAINVRIYQYSARLSIFGRFEFNAHRDFKHAYMPLLHNTALREIDIEMNKVDYMDSSALGMLMLLHERAKTAHKTVSLINASSAVAQFLEVANFSKIFNMKHAFLGLQPQTITRNHIAALNLRKYPDTKQRFAINP